MVRCAIVRCAIGCPAIVDKETVPFVRDFLAISVEGKKNQTTVPHCS
jgi:hypothetical protein